MEPKDLPDEIWSYLLKRTANLNDDQRKQIWLWDSRDLPTARMADFLTRLDRPEILIASQIAGQQGNYKPSYITEGCPSAPGNSATILGGLRTEPFLSSDALDSVVFSSHAPSADTVPYHGPTTDAEDDEFEFASELESWEYDKEYLDSDGEPLVDIQSQEAFYNFDPEDSETVFTEAEVAAMFAYGSMHRDSRKALQATHTGRDQKVVVKSKRTQQKKKSFPVKSKRSTVYRGKPPRKPFKKVQTPCHRHFSHKRGTKRQLMTKVSATIVVS